MPTPEDLPARVSSTENLPKVLRHALLEAADLQDLEVRAKEISRRSKLGDERPEEEGAQIT